MSSGPSGPMLNESIKKVKYTFKQDNKEILDKIESSSSF